MRAIMVKEPKKIEVLDVEEVQIHEANDVKIKIKAVGICGSDVGIYNGTNPMATYPRIIGHEMTGQVVEIGSDVTSLEVGDHVVVDPVISCGHCLNCKRGRFNICENLQVRGVHADGGFQEYVVAKDYQVYKVNSDMPWEKSVLCEPFSIGFNANRRAEVGPDDIVFVMGAGTIGQTVARVSKYLGAKVYTSDMDPQKLERAEKYGIIPIDVNKVEASEFIKNENDGRLPDVVIDAICTPKTFETAVKSVASIGRVVNLGFATSPSEICSVDITSKELTILGSRLSNRRFPEVIEAYNSGRLPFEDMVSHVMKFDEVEEAMKMIMDPKVYTGKVVLSLED